MVRNALETDIHRKWAIASYAAVRSNNVSTRVAKVGMESNWLV